MGCHFMAPVHDVGARASVHRSQCTGLSAVSALCGRRSLQRPHPAPGDATSPSTPLPGRRLAVGTPDGPSGHPHPVAGRPGSRAPPQGPESGSSCTRGSRRDRPATADGPPPPVPPGSPGAQPPVPAGACSSTRARTDHRPLPPAGPDRAHRPARPPGPRRRPPAAATATAAASPVPRAPVLPASSLPRSSSGVRPVSSAGWFTANSSTSTARYIQTTAR